MVDLEVRYTTVHNRRVKVVLQHQQSPKNLSKTLHLPSIKDRHSPSDRYNDVMDRPRSYSECGHHTSTLASRQKSRGEGPTRKDSRLAAAQLASLSKELGKQLRDFQDHVMKWSGSVDNGIAACAPIEILRTERQRVTARLEEMSTRLAALAAPADPDTGPDSVGAEARGGAGGTFITETQEFSTRCSRDNQEPTWYRSAPVGFEVQLNQALSSPELSTSDQLDATLSTMGDMCEHLGPFRDVSMKVCELVRSMTFESCTHDPVAGCVLLKVDKLEKQIEHQNNKLQQMTHNLERVMLPESRVLERDFPSDGLNTIAELRQEQLEALNSVDGQKSYATGDHPLTPAVSAMLAVEAPAHKKSNNKYASHVADCAYELAVLAQSYSSLQRLRKTVTPLHLLSSMRMSLIAHESQPKTMQYIMDWLKNDISSNLEPGDIDASQPAVRQVLTHFFQTITKEDFSALISLQDAATGETLYKITERFDFSSIELTATIESTFNQALAEMAEVTTKREVAFLTAKAQADHITIEELQKKLHSSQLECEDMQQRIKSLNNITLTLKKDLKQAAKGVFRERIDLHKCNTVEEAEQFKRKEERRAHTLQMQQRRTKGVWKEQELHQQEDPLKERLAAAQSHIEWLEDECDMRTPRYLTDDKDSTMDRLKNLLLQEGVFLKGKKGTRDTDIFILDLLLEKVNELKKTKELLEIIKENSGMGDPGGDNSAVQYHSGAGTGPTVPCFLRHRGKVKYHAIGKKEAEALLQDVWDGREQHQDQDFPDYFHSFLTDRFGPDEQAVTEYAYNLVHALEQFKWDADCNIFIKIIRKELPEEAVSAQSELMEDIIACVRLNYYSGEPKSSMTQDEFMKILKRAFPMKDPQDMSELEQALVATVGAGNNTFDPELIFEETEDFSETGVVEGIRAQFVLDLESFRCQVEDTLRLAADTGPDGISTVSVRKARDTLRMVDPLKPVKECQEIVHKIFDMPSVQDESSILLTEFIRRMRTVLIQPTLPPNSFLDKARAQKVSLEYQARSSRRSSNKGEVKK